MMAEPASDDSIDLDLISLEELGRVPDCRTDAEHINGDSTRIEEPHSTHCGEESQRELHRNPFPAEF